MNRLVKVWEEGVMKYERAYKLQSILIARLLQDAQSNKETNTLLLVEHPPVYTIGIRTKQYSKEEEEKLKALGADFCKTNRGGLITFHGPGQLVAYPIINLKHFRLGIHDYVKLIEKTAMLACKMAGLPRVRTSKKVNETGVWVGDNKICAIGVHASRYITSHGLALNCNTDLSWYEHIVPCGLEGKGVTSLTKELNRDVTTSEVIPFFSASFCANFECDVEKYSEEEKMEIKELL